ncbi:hypothetical protein AcV5_006674 [Taiwanofungus camphoratus]|nr:hypothetical protein AcV5_006674 [Antrodia cinnamomea]
MPMLEKAHNLQSTIARRIYRRRSVSGFHRCYEVSDQLLDVLLEPIVFTFQVLATRMAQCLAKRSAERFTIQMTWVFLSMWSAAVILKVSFIPGGHSERLTFPSSRLPGSTSICLCPIPSDTMHIKFCLSAGD